MTVIAVVSQLTDYLFHCSVVKPVSVEIISTGELCFSAMPLSPKKEPS